MNQFECQLDKLKFEYILSENKQLHEDLGELRQLLSVNKQIIQTLSAQAQSESNVIKSSLTCATIGKKTGTEINSPERRGLVSQARECTLIGQLVSENTKLLNLVSTITRQRDEARSQCLIYEQIAEECQRKEQESAMEYFSKLKVLEATMAEKDQKLSELEKQFEEQIAQRLKSPKRCIVYQTSSETLQLHQELMVLAFRLRNSQLYQKRLIKDRKDLLNVNLLLQEQISQFQSLIQHSNKNRISNQTQNNHDMSSSFDDSDFVGELPIKVHMESKNDRKIPSLQIHIAQQYQNQTVQEQEQQDAQQQNDRKEAESSKKHQAPHYQQHTKHWQFNKPYTPSGTTPNVMFSSPNKVYLQLQNMQEQLVNCQNELQQCKTNLHDEMLLSRYLQDELEKNHRNLENILNNNKLLIQSQQRIEEKWGQIWPLYHTYYNFYVHHKDVSLQNDSIATPNVYFLSPRALKVAKNTQTPSLLSFNPDLKTGFQAQKTSRKPYWDDATTEFRYVGTLRRKKEERWSTGNLRSKSQEQLPTQI